MLTGTPYGISANSLKNSYAILSEAEKQRQLQQMLSGYGTGIPQTATFPKAYSQVNIPQGALDSHNLTLKSWGKGMGEHVKSKFSPKGAAKAAGTISDAAQAADTVADVAQAADAVGDAAKAGGLFAPGLSAKLKGTVGNIANPQFDYSKATGISGWGHNIGGILTAANAIGQGINFAGALGDMSDAASQTNDLTADIVAGAMNNPMLTYDLTADQQQLLNELKRGSYNSSVDLSDVDMLGALGKGLTGALMGLPGGVSGAIVGGLGGLLNAGADSMASAQSRKNAELEALYAALQESNQNYSNLRKQRMLAGF